MNAFALTPPAPMDARFTPFRELIARAYRWRWQKECPWSMAEQNQLARLLRDCPKLEHMEFAHWLKNYMLSQDYPPGERPSRFLPRIHNYSIEPVDRYSRGKKPRLAETEPGIYDATAARCEVATCGLSAGHHQTWCEHYPGGPIDVEPSIRRAK